MDNINLDFNNSFVKEYEIEFLKRYIIDAHYMIHNKTGQGKEYLGWVDYPINYNKEEFSRIKDVAKRIQSNSQAFIVIGIGGSYIGARAIIEALNHSFYNDLSSEQRNLPQIYFVGNSLSGTYLVELLEVIKNKDISINVISKSGTTIEPAIAFRLLMKHMVEKYGENEAKNRIFVTTDKSEGALKSLADKEGYETFVIPNDIGGRYSVLTPVGMLPVAVAGINIDEIIEGAQASRLAYSIEVVEDNPCYQYGAMRNILYKKGKNIEILAFYEPSIYYFSEWWKQLFGESEGKDHKGIFPTSVKFSTDLHSLGQLLQDGRKDLFETILNVRYPKKDIKINEDANNLDNLNFLSDKTINEINRIACKATVLAHVDGGTPNIVINIPKLNEYYIGKIIYFFEKACAISGYLLGVNPFDQHGVEAYKNNMFALLNKHGYKELNLKLKERQK